MEGWRDRGRCDVGVAVKSSGHPSFSDEHTCSTHARNPTPPPPPYRYTAAARGLWLDDGAAVAVRRRQGGVGAGGWLQHQVGSRASGMGERCGSWGFREVEVRAVWVQAAKWAQPGRAARAAASATAAAVPVTLPLPPPCSDQCFCRCRHGHCSMTAECASACVRSLLEGRAAVAPPPSAEPSAEAAEDLKKVRGAERTMQRLLCMGTAMGAIGHWWLCITKHARVCMRWGNVRLRVCPRAPQVPATTTATTSTTTALQVYLFQRRFWRLRCPAGREWRQDVLQSEKEWAQALAAEWEAEWAAYTAARRAAAAAAAERNEVRQLRRAGARFSLCTANGTLCLLLVLGWSLFICDALALSAFAPQALGRLYQRVPNCLPTCHPLQANGGRKQEELPAPPAPKPQTPQPGDSPAAALERVAAAAASRAAAAAAAAAASPVRAAATASAPALEAVVVAAVAAAAASSTEAAGVATDDDAAQAVDVLISKFGGLSTDAAAGATAATAAAAAAAGAAVAGAAGAGPGEDLLQLAKEQQQEEGKE